MTPSSCALVPSTLAVVLRGQQANAQIDTATQDILDRQLALRQMWLDLGKALLEGKRQCLSDRAFGAWVKEHGFDNRPREVRTAAMSMARLTPERLSGVPAEVNHPQWVLRWLRENAKPVEHVPEDLKSSPAPASKPQLAPSTASKVNKLRHRAESEDEGADIARRHLEAYAKQFGLDVAVLVKAASEGDPDSAHRFSPPRQAAIDQWREGIKRDVARMEQSGIAKEAIRDLLIHLANSL